MHNLSTIKDISIASGYSCATISRALSNSESVKLETRDAIIKVAKEIGYKIKNIDQTNGTFMVIIGDLTNPFFMEIAQALSLRLEKERFYTAIFESWDNPEIEKRLFKFAQSRNYSGILMITATESNVLTDALKKITLPVVFINRVLRSLDKDVVCVDNYLGAYIATNYLIKMGHRKILHMAGPKDYSTAILRYNGFVAAMNDAGLQVSDKDVLYGSIKSERGYQDGKIIAKLKNNYTAVFSMNDIIAASLVNSLNEEGVNVPDDISIVCFDDTPLATVGKVKLTTVSKDTKSMGEAAAETMLFRLSNRDAPTRRITFSPSLIVRDSVKCLLD